MPRFSAAYKVRPPLSPSPSATDLCPNTPSLWASLTPSLHSSMSTVGRIGIAGQLPNNSNEVTVKKFKGASHPTPIHAHDSAHRTLSWALRHVLHDYRLGGDAPLRLNRQLTAFNRALGGCSTGLCMRWSSNNGGAFQASKPLLEHRLRSSGAFFLRVFLCVFLCTD